MSIPQRSYVYLAAFVAYAILLQGAYGLSTDVFRSINGLGIGGDPEATWIAMIIVALPVWLAHELLLRRAAANHSDETGSTLRKLYVHGALFLTTLYAAFGSIQIIEQLAGDFDGLEHIGGVIVAAGLWYYLWRRENLEGQPSPRAQTVKRWRIYGLSVIFLTAAVTATFWIALALAYPLYEFAIGASDTLLGPKDIGDPLPTVAAWALVGTVAWAVQWQTVATRDQESVLRQVYLYGFAFVGGAALALWGASATIYVVIAQLVGADYTATAAAYFRQFILPAVGLLLGLALLAYHWSIIRRDATSRFPSAESPLLSNTFKYIMSAVGLIALVPGIMVLVMIILFLLTEGDVLATENVDTEALAVALTMIIVGAPLWFAFWWRVVRADPHALIRRIYLYVALIALGGTWLFTLIALLAAVLTEILGQGSGFLDDALIASLSILIPAAAFFAYHVLILREDSHRTVDTTAAPSVIPSAAEESKDSITQTTSVTPPTPHTIPGPPYILPDWKSPRP